MLGAGEKVENKPDTSLTLRVSKLSQTTNKGTNRYLIINCDAGATNGVEGHDGMIREGLWEVTSEQKPEGWKEAAT